MTSAEQEPSFEELDQLVAARSGWRHSDDFPEQLFHYTSSTAFLNILQNDTLWFTDFRYLNDLSELRYGLDLFDEGLTSRISIERDPDLATMLPRLQKQLKEALVYTDIFVFCMCAENNLLNQWRVYGRDSVPLSIEFSTRGFLFAEWQPYGFELVPMVYDPQLQGSIVSNAIDAGLEYALKCRQAIFSSDDNIQSFVEMLASICVDWCASLKHPQFAVEKEWRLSTRWGLEHRSLSGRGFRSSPSGIVPYLAMTPIADELIDATRLHIRSITIGPCSYPDIQRRTLQELLFQRGRADAEVHVSGLPIRV